MKKKLLAHKEVTAVGLETPEETWAWSVMAAGGSPGDSENRRVGKCGSETC